MPATRTMDPFRVTDEEYRLLEKQFQDLAYFTSWQLMRKNVKNNHTEDLDDIMQHMRMAIIRAGRYHKRQVYIQTCLDVATKYARDRFVRRVVKELKRLWQNRTKHGANKQKFGPHQERMLNFIVQRCVPAESRPDVGQPLQMDRTFIKYCKAITWNEQKSLGRKISRERTIRSGQVSLSDFTYLGAYED